MKMDPSGLELLNLEAFGVFDGPRILEIGCGDGRATATLAGRAGVLAAVDPGEDALRQAAGRIDGVVFAAASGEQLPFPDRSFDTLLFSLSLHHQDSRRALREAGRVVRPGGRILVMEPAVDGEVQLLFHCFRDETPELEAAQTALAASGLSVVKTTQFETDWEFPDKFAFSRYLFAYHDQERNAAMETRLFRQIGSKVDACPLVLKDRLKLMSLAL